MYVEYLDHLLFLRLKINIILDPVPLLRNLLSVHGNLPCQFFFFIRLLRVLFLKMLELFLVSRILTAYFLVLQRKCLVVHIDFVLLLTQLH